MTITSVEFWDEIRSLALSVLTEYEHSEIEAVKELQKELTELREGQAESQVITEKETEIADAIEALTVNDLDDVYDRIHEMVDNHGWVIYYSNAWNVARLMSSDENTCREFEELCCIQNGKSLDDLICQFAYCALNSNVVAEMETALEEYKETLKKEV
jgi:hypothetical protein